MSVPHVQVQLEGDTSTAALYVGWAKGQCVRLHQECLSSGLPYRTKHTRIGADIEVVIQATASPWGNIVRIKVSGSCPVYVDHGFLGMGNLAPMNYLRYSDGQLLLPSHLTSNLLYASQNITAAGLGSNNEAPFVSGSAPGCCKKKVFPPETPSAEIAAANEAFYAHKLTLTICPPSMYSGKLRLFVQALYGRKYGDSVNDNYRAIIESGIPKVRVRTNIKDGNDVTGYITLSNIGGQSHGLYTDSVGGYWLLWLHTSNGLYRVTIYRVELAACMKPTAAWLASQTGMSKADKAIQEAALLADAKIDYNFSWTVETGLTNTYGGPIAYGWSFKWDGSQAIMTCQKFNVAGTAYISTRLTLNFSRANTEFAESSATELDEEKARWTVTGSAVNMGTWNPQIQQQHIWYPNYFGSEMELFYNPPNFTGSGSGEVACLFNKNDVIQPIQITAISAPFEATEEYSPDVYRTSSNTEAYLAGYPGFVETRSIGGGHEGSITGGGVTLNSISRTITAGGRSEWTVTDTGAYSAESTSFIPRTEFAIPDPGTCATPSDCWQENLGALSGYHAADEAYSEWSNAVNPDQNICGLPTYYKYTTANIVRTQWSLTGFLSEHTAIIFPFWDCSTVYLCTNGRTDSTTRVGTNIRTGTQYGKVSWRSTCFGGSEWFENYYIKDGAGGLTTTGTPASETVVVRAAEVVHAVGYNPPVETGYNIANSVFAVIVTDPKMPENMYTRSSVVDGMTILYNDVIVGSYDVSSLGALTFVGAA